VGVLFYPLPLSHIYGPIGMCNVFAITPILHKKNFKK
jgi:hypothetical protein